MHAEIGELLAVVGCALVPAVQSAVISLCMHKLRAFDRVRICCKQNMIW